MLSVGKWRDCILIATLSRSALRQNGPESTFGVKVFQEIYQFCTSYGGMVWLILASDFSIAFAYFAIPIVMAVVLRHRKNDIPYPWLWILFVTFIIACGLTHVVHVWSAFTGIEYLGAQVV